MENNNELINRDKVITRLKDALPHWTKRAQEGAYNPEACYLSVDYGPRYARIAVNFDGHGRSAWAFVRLDNGDILKPANWKAPAKHARGSVLAEDYGLSRLGPHGPAYLR